MLKNIYVGCFSRLYDHPSKHKINDLCRFHYPWERVLKYHKSLIEPIVSTDYGLQSGSTIQSVWSSFRLVVQRWLCWNIHSALYYCSLSGEDQWGEYCTADFVCHSSQPLASDSGSTNDVLASPVCADGSRHFLSSSIKLLFFKNN